jgi:TonB family protein
MESWGLGRRKTPRMTASQLLAMSLLLVLDPALMGQSSRSSPRSKGRDTYEAMLAQYLSDKDQAKARLGYLAAIEQEPLLIEPWLKLASLAMSDMDWKEAFARLEEVLQIGTDPNQTEAIRKELTNLSYVQKYGSPGVFSALDPDVQVPSVITKTDPRYTKDALKARLNGNVLVWLEVDEGGVPANLQIIEGLGHGLNDKALKAAAKWRFKAATKNGALVRCGAVITINFQIRPR